MSLRDLRDTVVQHTLVAGKVVYDAGSSSARAATARTAASGAGATVRRHEHCCGREGRTRLSGAGGRHAAYCGRSSSQRDHRVRIE